MKRIYLLTTEHLKKGLWFREDEDFRVAMNFVAIQAATTLDVVVLAFILMSNHVHFVLLGTEEDVEAFINAFKQRYSMYYQRKYGVKEFLRHNGVDKQPISYSDEGPEKAISTAEIIAGDLRAHGLNGDLAPVADVWSNPDNPVIRTRAYSDDFDQASELVAAAVEGFHAGGVLCTLKHFPGHGDTASDSHYGAAYVTKSREELQEGELKPFRAGIEAGADMVMIGHLTVPALDEAPAPFSYAIVTELLRQELGFTGVIITDALEMGALGDYTSGETAVLAMQAGVDLLLCPGDPAAALQALRDAVAEGAIPQARIDESVLRILRMKLSLAEREER